jgi:hypothetical protein
MDSPDHALPDDIDVSDGRERLGRAHQLGVDIAIALSLAPAWLRRSFADRNPAKGARVWRRPISGETVGGDASLQLYSWLGSRLSAVWSPSPDDPRAPVFGRAARGQSLAWQRRFYR